MNGEFLEVHGSLVDECQGEMSLCSKGHQQIVDVFFLIKYFCS